MTVDFKMDRIRIAQRTLRCLGDPAHILLLVNPARRTVAIVRGDCLDLRAQCLLQAQSTGGCALELYSKPLVRNLLALSDDWHDNCAYRLHGEVTSDGGAIHFDIATPIAVHKERRDSHG